MTLLPQTILEIEKITARELASFTAPNTGTDKSPTKAPPMLRPVSYPRAGSFSGPGPMELLENLTETKFTGKLEVTDEARAITKTVFFANGQIVFAASSQWKDRLGSRLLDSGRIRQEDLDLVQLMFGNRRLGDALVKAGVLRRQEVDAAVSQQVAGIVSSVLSMGDADYRVEQGPLQIPSELLLR